MRAEAYVFRVGGAETGADLGDAAERAQAHQHLVEIDATAMAIVEQ